MELEKSILSEVSQTRKADAACSLSSEAPSSGSSDTSTYPGVGNNRTQVIWRRRQEGRKKVIGEEDGRTIQKEKEREDVRKSDGDSYFIFI